jgi:hypothetical protein
VARQAGRANSASPGGGHQLADLVRMNQFDIDEDGRYFDLVQHKTMQDFYTILQNRMDPDLRREFFDRFPPALDTQLDDISKVKGTKGTDPGSWYRSLSVPYAATGLANFSDDPGSKLLNASRGAAVLTDATTTSDVMQAQGPLLYQRQYEMLHENLNWFLNDQKANTAKHDPVIDAMTAKWREQARTTSTGTAEQLAEMDKQLAELGSVAKRDKLYWAFALYTYYTSPEFLNMLRGMVSSGGSTDGSEFSRWVQRAAAQFNILDPSGFFTQRYTYILQLFELGCLMPEMFDFGTEIKGLEHVIELIIGKFVESYADSPDETMREIARQLRADVSPALIGSVLDIMRTAGSVAGGLFQWDWYVAKCTSEFNKAFGTLPRSVTRGILLGACSSMLHFLVIGSVDFADLTEAQQASFIIGSVNIFSNLMLLCFKHLIAVGSLWSTTNGAFGKFVMAFNPLTMIRANHNAVSGLSAYLLKETGPKRGPLTAWLLARESLAAGVVQGAEKKSPTVLRTLFGKNLSRFMATRVAGFLGVVGIVMSALELAKGGEPLEKATHAMFLLAAALELAAVLGGWLLAGSTIKIGGMLISTLFSCVSWIGFLALLAGAALLIYQFLKPNESPVTRFARERAGDLYMPYKVAVESLQLFEPVGHPRPAGVAVYRGERTKDALRIGADGKLSTGPVDATGHTGFYLKPDHLGRVQIGAPILDATGAPVLQALSATDVPGEAASVNLGALPPTEINLKTLWYAQILGEGVREKAADGAEQLRSAPFRLRSAHWAARGQTRYLARTGGPGSGWSLSETAGADTVLTIELVPLKPAELAMINVHWYTIAHDEQTEPALQVPGTAPRRWSIIPQLPPGLSLNPEDGRVAMEPGRDIPAAARREYTVTAHNDLGSVTAVFELEVGPPPPDWDAPVAATAPAA